MSQLLMCVSVFILNLCRELRPLIQYRRDRDTNKVFEVLDGQMLKDGYLYKKVSIDSLSCAGVVPSEEELLKFKSSEKNEADDLEWLSQLYGDWKKKRTIRIDKGVGKERAHQDLVVWTALNCMTLLVLGESYTNLHSICYLCIFLILFNFFFGLIMFATSAGKILELS